MKLKKKAKKILIILVIILVVAGGFIIYKTLNNSSEVKETKVISKIKGYGYTLKENKPKAYKEMFSKLKELLEKSSPDEEEYVTQISKMFIYDFYSLNDKTAKTDVGGVDFVYSEVKDNFLLNAENTYYKYVESNIYNNRKQSLPIVSDSSIKVEDISQEAFAYGEKTDDEAYTVKITWDYTSSSYSDYQKEATLVFIHDDKKLSLVELQ